MDGRSEAVNPLLERDGVRISRDFEDESGGNNNTNCEQSNGDVSGSSNSVEGSEDETNEVNPIMIKDMVDIMKIDLENFCVADVERYEFVALDVAYMFYSWFARMSGFSVRKGQVVRDRNGEVVQQTFVCSCQGYREDRGLTMENRKREPKNETRCGCNAKFRVHLDILSRHWYVTVFEFDHNHAMLGGTLCGMLPAYRKMSVADIAEIERSRKAGIRPYQMYGALADASGGFHKVGFVKKDLYNQVAKQRKSLFSDACGAVKYLRDLCKDDPLMFVRSCIDDDRRLERLFWCDGESRMNYEIFGDVLAFDATYRKNKYNCPFVVFSGVNHHNQTIVFATGIVTRETEETYVWLLEQFLIAMNGKPPLSVITDGDLAMKNAIKKVFPAAHHRLCAWHLLRNASTNIGIPDFMSYLKKCMLADIEVNKFEELWSEMVQKFGLEDNTWINEMYEKKKMWATAHIRGSFFAGVKVIVNLVNFLEILRFAEVKIANTTRNPLKLFYSCKEGRCGFLDWAHPIGCGCNHTYNAENVGVIDDIIDGNKVIDSVVERIVPVEDRVEEIAVGMGEIKTLIRHAKLMFVTMTLVFAAFFFVLVI